MKNTITNYKLGEFAKQSSEVQERYNSLLRYLEPSKTVREVFTMSLGEVEEIKHALRTGNEVKILECVKLVQDITEDKEIYNMSIIDFYGILNSMKAQIEKIIKLEEQSLRPKYPNAKWNMVNGSEKMSKFGIINTLDELSGNDITKHDQILSMPYNRVFGVLYKRTVKSDIEMEMTKIKD